jgi:hypothetical protein
MVAQRFLKRSDKILTVRSRKYRTYQAAVPKDLDIPEDLQKGDTVFVEFRNGTPIVTGFELAERKSDEEIRAELEQQRQDLMDLGGDY